MGYSNLIKFMVQELGYSGSAAYRRYQALKLTSEVPKVKEKIQDGSLNLSKITQMETILKGEATKTKERAILKIEALSARESEKALINMLPESKQEEVKARRNTNTVNLNDKTIDKIDKLKKKFDGQSSEQIINYALDMAIYVSTRKNKSSGSTNNRYFSARTKKIALNKSGFQCQYKGCREIQFLEYDHIKPFALGGNNHSSNIRILCREHNLFLSHKFTKNFRTKL